MTDLEITRLCAEAMGLKTVQYVTGDGCLCTANEKLKKDFYFDPLHDDAQALALVKKFGLAIDIMSVRKLGWCVWPSDDALIVNVDLNRAICECVARIEEAKHEKTL